MSGELLPSSGSVSGGASEGADRQRVEQWYLQQVEWLQVFVFGLLRNRDHVADVLQVVFHKAIEHGAAVDPSSVRAWLTRVAHNEAMLLKRKQGVNSRALKSIGAAWIAVSRPDSGRELAPPDALIQQETAQHLREVLQQLPEEQRRVVELRIDEDRSFAQIAEECGVPLGTVLTRMRLALGKLRLALDDAKTQE